MNAFKLLFLKRLTEVKGRVISLASGLAVGALTKWFADNNWSWDPEYELLVSGAVAFAVTYIIDSVVILLQTEGVKQIQDALPPEVVSDGVAGPVTVAAVEKVVANQQTP